VAEEVTKPTDEPSDDELMELADELGYPWPLDAQAEHDLVNAWRVRGEAEALLMNATLRPDEINKPETEQDGMRAEALRRLKVRRMLQARPGR
jgi:hypothetical protein